MINTCTPSLALPAITDLAQHDRWVVWKLQERRNKSGELKQAKVPFNPRTQRTATNSLIDHCTSFEAACAASPRYNGIGFVFAADDPYCGVDLDGCRDPETGRITRWAWRWIMRLDSYTEVSPSSTGVKIFLRGTIPESIKGELGNHKGIEVYTDKRYFCVTGQHLPGTPNSIRDAQEALTYLYLVLARLQRLRRFTQRSRLAPKSFVAPVPRNSPAESAAGRLTARETIDQANTEHDLGDLLTTHGATLVATRGTARYYDGLHGDTHDHHTTYIVSPARDGSGYIGHSYSPNGQLNNSDFPRGFRWFDAFAALEHSGDVVAALKAVTPHSTQAARPLPPHPGEMPEYLTVEDAARRSRWRQEKQQQREREREQRQDFIHHYSNVVTTDPRLGERERTAWAVHCTFFANGGKHCVSIAAQAARLCGVDQADESHVRRMQRANERLIACGYLGRTDRRDGSNRQTSWWEPCAAEQDRVTDAQMGDSYAHEAALPLLPEADRVTRAAEAHRVTTAEESNSTVTLQDQEAWSISTSGACERGRECQEGDYELIAEAASFDPSTSIVPSGEYTCRTKHLLTFDELWEASRSFRQAQRAEAPLAEEIDVLPLPASPPLPRQRERVEVSPLDRYRLKLATMSETQLAGELKKHRRTLRKHAGKSWLAEIERRVRAVEAEIDYRAAPVAREVAPNSQALQLLYQQPLLALVPP